MLDNDVDCTSIRVTEEAHLGHERDRRVLPRIFLLVRELTARRAGAAVAFTNKRHALEMSSSRFDASSARMMLRHRR